MRNRARPVRPLLAREGAEVLVTNLDDTSGQVVVDIAAGRG